jgi:hypothetical protein
LAPNYFGQVDTSTENGNSGPSPNTDWIAKVTFDPKAAHRSIHFEVAGLMNRFAFYNPINNRRFNITGGAVALNALVETAPHLTLASTNFYTNGGGNFIFGEAPDLIIQGTGAPSLLPAASTVDGFEYEPAPKWAFWVYYGGTWIDRISTFDSVAFQPVGYGYVGSPNSQNRTIQEVTTGFHRVLLEQPELRDLTIQRSVLLACSPSMVRRTRSASKRQTQYDLFGLTVFSTWVAASVEVRPPCPSCWHHFKF